MSHPRWPGYNTKTGNPVYDNRSARMNKRLYREMKVTFRVSAAGRKRKKQIKRIEGGRYIQVWNEAMIALHRNRITERGSGKP